MILEQCCVETAHCTWFASPPRMSFMAWREVGVACSDSGLKHEVVDALTHCLKDDSGHGVWLVALVDVVLGGMSSVAGSSDSRSVQAWVMLGVCPCASLEVSSGL